MTRIADGTTAGHASYSRDFAIGYKSCAGCKDETPAPPQAVLDELAFERSGISTVWPFEHWKPGGWTQNEIGTLCDACSRSVRRLLVIRRDGVGVSDGDDYSILRESVRAALEIAAGALLSDFPRSPTLDELEKGWGHVHSYDLRLRFFRENQFRDQLRAIRKALTGSED